MPYRIEQSDEYKGNGYWDWSTWIEAEPAELDRIERVVWLLHPTFTPSRIESRSRETRFLLHTSGWGTFRLRAELHLPSQAPQTLTHVLRLRTPDGEESAEFAAAGTVPEPGKAAAPGGPVVFLSYSSEDELPAQQLRQTIESLGARVLDPRSLSAGLPMDAAIRKMIRESDGVISFIGSDYASPWVVGEIKLATAERLPVLTLLPNMKDWPSGLPRGVASMNHVEDSSESRQRLEGFVRKLGSPERELPM